MSEISEALEAANSAEEVEPTVETPVEETPEAPSETTETADEEVTEEAVAETETSQELFDLPDGRKVDGQTLAKEWKENFLPDYTRKSQELAKISKPETEQGPKWKSADWQPETYAELLEAAKESVFTEMEQAKQMEVEKKEQVDSWVQGQLDEIKTLEPNVSEELLFQHANKYNFGDLKTAFQNMKDFNLAVKHTEQKVLKNLKTREAEPIAAKPNAGEVSDGIDFNFDRNESASEALARIKGN